ncbi:NFAT activation molecule 1 isoform X2 [Manis pentadactyla]|uniref:NFAT activation molecule 1 isoform X2 n=1 Tax=Manis pentadactyla TaxID=143292 RepID=UPI00255D0A1C|nr:NFAT activation molecule 1 isoform X2 [Manis pentadactyla]
MERPWWRATRGPLVAPWLLGLLLCPWTLRLTGGQSVTHTGPPILVSLANQTVNFNCTVTYKYTREFKAFRVNYFHVDLQGRESSQKQTDCQSGSGKENATYSVMCCVSPELPDAAATGTYYCSVQLPQARLRGSGTFILVRDSGYREPPQGPGKLLLFCFAGLLSVLSVLATALLLWKKQMQVPQTHLTQKCLDPSPASSPQRLPAESIYTALQRRETEVYACMENKASSPPTTQSLLSQEKLRRFKDDSEFNLVYENL